MAEIIEGKNKLLLTCDCGAVHTIKKNETEELEVSSTFKKPIKKNEEEDNGEESGKTKKRKSDWF